LEPFDLLQSYNPIMRPSRRGTESIVPNAGLDAPGK
jgi:hypothetical protein